MYQPTGRAVVLVVLGAPLSLLIGVVGPDLWLVGLAWIAVAFALIMIDTALAWSDGEPTLTVNAPPTLSINAQGKVGVAIAFPRRAPTRVEATLDLEARLQPRPVRVKGAVRNGQAEIAFDLTPIRRGAAQLYSVWVRWAGPMGLVRRQAVQAIDLIIAVTPDIDAVKSEAIRLFSRQGLGTKSQLDAGEGAEFHALLEFHPGMDTRRIDWKQSARHHQLFAREYRAERNHPVVLALDCGRSMCEPVAGVPRLDWALNAALLLAYVSLRVGDRAGLYAFDAKPRAMSGTVTGVRAFAALERLASSIDYSPEESNYTLGLFTLLGQLKRRSLVVVFTEFADATSAELMIEAVERLLARHLVVFVVTSDEELESLRDSEPRTPEDVSKAVIAANLLRERDLVLTRLRRLGVEIIDAPARRMQDDLLNRYLDLKRRNRL